PVAPTSTTVVSPRIHRCSPSAKATRQHAGGISTTAGREMTTEALTPESAVPAASETMVSVRDLKKHFPIMKGIFRRQVGAVRAVDGINFDIYHGETLGLVGESGSGKSTAGRTILQLETATEGSITFDGTQLIGLKGEKLRS